jgi:RNA polymerase sigma factor (sigma-70 family)
MSDATNYSTSPTLLRRLRHNPTDQAAWDEFVHRYSKIMAGWCARWGLQPADAQDVVQNVLLDLARQMRTFTYNPSGRFRGWLKTVTHRAWCDFLERRQRQEAGSGDSVVLCLLVSIPAREDFLRRLDEECDREIMEVAIECVRGRVHEHTWEAFRRTAIEGLSGANVAAQLGIKVGTVYVARGKVERMLREEVSRLENEDDSRLAVGR